MAVVEQTLVQVRIDKDLRDAAARIYTELGMDIPTAVRMFLKRSVVENGLPFRANLPDRKITREQALWTFEEAHRQTKDVPEMTLEEINEEIAAVRAERRARA